MRYQVNIAAGILPDGSGLKNLNKRSTQVRRQSHIGFQVFLGDKIVSRAKRELCNQSHFHCGFCRGDNLPVGSFVSPELVMGAFIMVIQTECDSIQPQLFQFPDPLCGQAGGRGVDPELNSPVLKMLQYAMDERQAGNRFTAGKRNPDGTEVDDLFDGSEHIFFTACLIAGYSIVFEAVFAMEGAGAGDDDVG